MQTAKFDISPITHNYWVKLRLNYILNNWVITIRGSGGRSSPEARGYFNAKSENFNTRKNFFGGLVGGDISPLSPPWIRPCNRPIVKALTAHSFIRSVGRMVLGYVRRSDE